MAKISQATSKYIIKASINIEGVVERPDVVGAIFGQVEGLLGSDLELRELQKSGRIGRIEVHVESKSGKTSGSIEIPSSLDKAETAIIGGALETIERIGPCDAVVAVEEIKDERIEKRQKVINRAKELLKKMNDTGTESSELSSEVTSGIRLMEIGTFGPGLACGPDILEEKEIIFVEGRADVVNLLKHGIKNVVSINGSNIPKEIQQLSKEKNVTVFCDGDRGGDLIIKALLETCKIDYITKAPDGKEVEELQQKELLQALRHKKTVDEWTGKKSSKKSSSSKKTTKKTTKPTSKQTKNNKPSVKLSDEQTSQYKKLHKELKKNKDAYVLDKQDKILGKLAIKDLEATLPSLDNVQTVIIKADVDEKIAQAMSKGRIKTLVANGGEENMRTNLIIAKDL
ncbi:MAG: DNA primase DnaG [Candidatus Woesearchaeota archaeon]